MINNPLVSVIIPTFNRSELILGTIKNVLNQTWKKLEIIIIDDGTTDETKHLILSLDDKILKYNKNKNNIGCALSRLIGVQMAKGDYIAFLDDDDEWDKNYLQNQLKIFTKQPFLDLVISNYVIKNENNVDDIRNMEPFVINFKKKIHEKPGPFFQCCLFKRKILQEMEKLLDSNTIPSEDWDFFMNLSILNPSIGYSNQIGFKWNLSNLSQSSNLIKEAKGINYLINKHKKNIIKICGFTILSSHYRRIAMIYEKIGDFKNTKQFYNKAYLAAPYYWKNFSYFLIMNLCQKIGFNVILKKRKIF